MTTVSGIPAFQQLAADLRRQIETGTLPPGAQLPSMSQLRQQYGVSNTVVRDALNDLRRASLIIGQQGKGVYVTEHPTRPNTSTSELSERIEQLAHTIEEFHQRLSKLEQAIQPKPRTHR